MSLDLFTPERLAADLDFHAIVRGLMKPTPWLLESESLVHAWKAARRGPTELPAQGSLVLTNWRIAWVSDDGGFAAMPIVKVSYLDVISPLDVVIGAWYDRAWLVFAQPDTLEHIIRLLRQAPGWCATEIGAYPSVGRSCFDPASKRGPDDTKAPDRRLAVIGQ